MDPLPEQERFEVFSLSDYLSDLAHELIHLSESFLDLEFICFIQINYRDFLQSPLQVILIL